MRLVLATLAMATTLPAGESLSTGEFLNRTYRDDEGDHKYVVFLPKNYSDNTSWPVIVWLHGASARGKDGRAPLVSGIGPNIARRRDSFPFIVVFPQCENLHSRLLGGWTDEPDDADRALRILEAVEREFRVDARRRVLAGVSMGAFGTWAVAAKTPQLWSAVVPVSGGGPLSLADGLKGVPVWAFHAADDQVVPPSASKTLVDEVAAAGGRAYYTQLPNGGHNIGSRVFAKDELYEWLLDPTRPPREPVDWPLDIAADLQLQNEVPFVPGAEVDRAVQICIGADVLDALAWALPAQVPAQALQGARGPQRETTGSRWMRFQVTVPGVQYSGRLHAAQMQLLPDRRLRLRFGFMPLQMTIPSTEIEGRLLRAQAGAVHVVIGSQRPAWLTLVVRPRVESRRLRLELVSADFPLEPDNWYVTEPAHIDVRPLPILRNRISQRITDGVYAKQGEISRQVLAGVPRMLEQIEQQTQARLDRTVTFGRWPMPVWQPRAKFWMSDIDVTSDGVRLTLGATLAALAPQTDSVPLKRHAGPEGPPPATAHGIQIAVAADVVAAWTELLADSEVRFFHVQDFHAAEFHRLADRRFLADVLPGWGEGASQREFRSVLSFEQPLEVQVGDASGTTSIMRLSGRELRLTISERTAPEANWSPVAEFPLSWRQDIRFELASTGHRGRRIRVSAARPPEVSARGRVFGRYAESGAAPDHARVAEQFRRGWETTFATALAKEIRLPERMIAGVPFVCDELCMSGEHLVMRLAKPTTQIHNISHDPVVYEIRLPAGSWSEPHTLPPGMMHEFAASAPLTWRYRAEGREFQFTLPVGSVSRFRGGASSPLTLSTDGPPPLAGWPEAIFR